MKFSVTSLKLKTQAGQIVITFTHCSSNTCMWCINYGCLRTVNYPILHCKDRETLINSHNQYYAYKKIAERLRYSNRAVTIL